MGSSGVVTEWEPPVRLGYEEHGWNGDAPPVATEVVVTSRSGDRCVVRMVVERVHQDAHIREIMLRLTAPVPGVAVIGSIYLYGAAAGDAAATEQPKGKTWMAELVHAHSVAT